MKYLMFNVGYFWQYDNQKILALDSNKNVYKISRIFFIAINWKNNRKKANEMKINKYR
jgi:hypothetical protein